MPRGYLAVATAAAFWGISGTLAKFMFHQSVDPAVLSNFRLTFSFLLLAAYMWLFRPELLRVPPGQWGPIAIWTLAGLTPTQYTYMLAIKHTNVATAIFLQYLMPVVVALYIKVARRQPMGRTLAGALFLATGGGALLIFGAGAGLRLSPVGLAAGLLSCLFFSFYTVYGGTLVGRINSWTLLVWALGMGALVWNLVLPPWVTIPQIKDPLIWGFFAYLALLATIVPFGLFLWGLRQVAPTPAALTGMLEPVVGALAAWFALGETLWWPQVSGGIMILTAVSAAHWQGHRTRVHHSKGA